MTSGLSLWPAEACLVTELAAELAALSDAELRTCHVILPTKRLHTWLYALLSEQRPAFVPPRCFTFEDFISRYAEAYGLDESCLRPLGDLEQELLLAALLKGSNYTHLKLGHEHELKQLFAELTDWGLGEAAFPALLEVAQGNVYLSEGSVDTLSQRFTELSDLYGRYRTAAAEGLGAEPVGDARARLSDRLAATLETSAALPGARLYLVGLTSSQGMHARLWRALAERPEARIWLNEPPALASPKNPLALLLQMLGKTAAGCRLPTRPKRSARSLAVHRADTVLGEVAHALELAKAAIQGGLAPSAIALLVTNDAAYGKPLRALLKGARLTANLALATPLSATLSGTWLAALFELLASDQAAARVLALATHPLTLAWWRRTALKDLPEGVQPAAGWEAELKARLVKEICRSGVERGLAFFAAAPGISSVVSGYLAALGEALGEFGQAEAQLAMPLSAWSSRLKLVAETFILAEAPRPGAASSSEDIGLALSARESIEGFLAALGGLPAEVNPMLSRSEMLALLREKLLGQDVRSVGDPLKGLQVLSIAEARYVPFELAIVLGCVEGDFPQALPKDHLVDNYFKARIGLPGWQLLEAIQDTTFHLLSARLPQTVLLYPASRGGEAVVRSRFIEAALARGEAVEQRARRDATLLGLLQARLGEPVVPAAERAGRRGGDQGTVPPGWRESLLSPLSASSLESLIRCPYRFLLMRLGVEAAELPEEDDARKEGDWLHDVLEAFFTGRAGDKTVAPPLDGSVAAGDFRGYALKRLDELTEKLSPPHAKDSPLELHVRLRSWPAFVEHLLRLYNPETLKDAALGWRERSLEGEGSAPLVVAVGEHRVRLRGVIDSVDFPGSDLHVITDYKRSGTPDRASVRSGLSPQLLLYAEALAAGQNLPLSRAVVGYWSILKGTWTEALAGSEVQDLARSKGLVSARDKETLEGAVGRLKELWAWRQDELSGSEALYSPDPSACGFCRYTGVCRKDDPELGPGVIAGDALSRRLTKDGGRPA